MKISKQWKKHLEISSFNTSVPKNMIICFIVPEIWHIMDIICCSGLIFEFPKNENFKKKKRNKSLEISSFHACVPNIMNRWCTVPEIWCATDKQTEGRMDKKTDTQSWVPHLKYLRTDQANECIFRVSGGTQFEISLLGANNGVTFVGSMWVLVCPKKVWICHWYCQWLKSHKRRVLKVKTLK